MATVFVGGSALLLAGAMAALAFGFANGEEALVWIALLASGAAAVFLVVAYGLSRRELRRSSSSTLQAEAPTSVTSPPADPSRAEVPAEATGAEEGTTAEQGTTEKEGSSGPDETGSTAEASPEAVSDEAGPQAVAAGSPTATKPSTVKRGSSPGTVATAKPSSPSDPVVGIASKKKFHRLECRYAKSESAEEMTRAAARRRGFTPCGICKP